jgi:hypothetical protein
LSQIEKIVQFHINRLKDKSVDVQLKSIQELQLLGAQAEVAMPALRDLFETSENEAVKRAAQQAGLVIFTKSKDANEQG